MQNKRTPFFSFIILFLIVAGCLVCDFFTVKNPVHPDLGNCNMPPGKEFLFGTDTMGRDIFSMIWHGGRVSLLIGIAATVVSTVIAVIFGTVSGCAPGWGDHLLMRLLEILFSIPNLLLVIFLQAVLGKGTVAGISFVIGMTGWMSIAKVVRTEVRKLQGSGYVVASRCMGGGFFHVLWKHLMPNCMPSVMFMIVMNIRNAILTESTLSFMGLGLPVEEISWGSMLSVADDALLANSWWMVVFPGAFLLITMFCVTDIADYLRKILCANHSGNMVK